LCTWDTIAACTLVRPLELRRVNSEDIFSSRKDKEEFSSTRPARDNNF